MTTADPFSEVYKYVFIVAEFLQGLCFNKNKVNPMLGLKLGLWSNYHGFKCWSACGAFHLDMDLNFICLKGIEVPIGTNGVLIVAFL